MRFLYWLIISIIDWWYEFRNDLDDNGFWQAIEYQMENIKDRIDNFFYEHHHNGVFGPGGNGYRIFKSGNLALLIAILTTIGFILYVILN